jgi:hypothetical protein
MRVMVILLITAQRAGYETPQGESTAVCPTTAVIGIASRLFPVLIVNGGKVMRTNASLLNYYFSHSA